MRQGRICGRLRWEGPPECPEDLGRVILRRTLWFHGTGW